MKYAVIDIGSNSIRLMVSDGEKTLFKRLISTRLSSGSTLKEDAIERSVEAIRIFKNTALQENCDVLYAFATEAVRSASNKEDFLSKCRDIGVDVDVIDGDVEAKIGFAGVYEGGTIAVIDIGGASSELAIGDKNGLIYTKSLKTGCVRLKDAFGEDIDRIREYAKQLVGQYEVKGISFDRLYSIGGTASTYASVDEKMTEYDANKIHGKVMTAEKIERLAKYIASVPTEKRSEIKGLPDKRKDIIVGGGILLVEIMRYLNVNELTVSESDNLEGYLKYKTGKIK